MLFFHLWKDICLACKLLFPLGIIGIQISNNTVFSINPEISRHPPFYTLYVYAWLRYAFSLSLFIYWCFWFESSQQLGYVIYRRVLRYYSGEEDGLGEWHIQPSHHFSNFLQNSWCILCLLTDLPVIFRYEESIITGCREKIHHPPQKASDNGRTWIWLIMGLHSW